MYPSTTFIWNDESTIAAASALTPDTLDRPVFMMGFSSDKGPEEFQNGIMGTQFYNSFISSGTNPSFINHGQPLIQAANIIDSGGKLFCKRIVAEDSMLANIGVVANVQQVSVQATDSTGAPLYTNGTTQTTNPVGNQPVMIQQCQISFSLKTVNIAGDSVSTMASAFLADNQHTGALGSADQYALFLLTDTGRGLSNKTFRIYTNTNVTKPVQFTSYVLEISENGNVLESLIFSFNPTIVQSSTNISLQQVVMSQSQQVRCQEFDSEINAFMQNVAYMANIPYATYQYSDVLSGNDINGNPYTGVSLNTAVVSLNALSGIGLLGGSNGGFGTSPITSSTYNSQMVQVFNGTAGDQIYDMDNCQIDVIFDANYDPIVKRAIENLVTFREDCFYFRDLGIGLNSIDQIQLINSTNLLSRLCATYHNSWDIIDAYSYKQITVTSTFSMCSCFVNQYLNGVARPFCGILYSITFPNVITGTINFIPKNTPALDQKQWFDDNRINYASYYNGLLVMNTEYTSQNAYTQLSWLHNVLLIQQIIKQIRTYCPKIRYNFITGNDLAKYAKDVEAVLNQYTSLFDSIGMTYVQNETYANNKIFYAVINVTFKNFVQSEVFTITALPTTD